MGGWRRLVRLSVIVNLDTGRSFEGVLWSSAGGLLTLKNAAMLEAGREAVPVDGEVVVDRARVEFLQVLEGRRS